MDIYTDLRALGNGYLNENAAIQREQNYFNVYLRKLIELSANSFKWPGLPPEIDVRYMELTILRRGFSLFYYEKAYNKFMARPASGRGMRNHMDEVTQFDMTRLLAQANLTTTISKGRCVPIYGNYLQTPDTDLLMMYASKLARIDTTLDVNTIQLRTPRLIVGNKNQRQTIANINRQIEAGVESIGVTGSFDPENSIVVLDTGANPDTVEKLHIARGRIWNQCMSLLGINNANQDKKERLVADEVAANDEQVEAMKAVRINARKHACAEINRLYDGSAEKAKVTGYHGPPLNVSVEFSTRTEMPALPTIGGDDAKL